MTDAQRETATALRRLLIKIENGRGQDRDLGADLLNVLDAPPLMGDPTACIDCAFGLVAFLRQDRFGTFARAVLKIDERCKCDELDRAMITHEDVARTMAAIAVRVHLAKLEAV